MDHSIPQTHLLISIGKKVKRISLQRYLLSKFYYEVDRIKEADVVCLFENQLWLESKSLKDSQFYRKFGKEVFYLSELLKNQNSSELSPKSLRRLTLRFTSNVPDFLVPKRNYGQWKSRFAGSFHLNPILSKEVRDFYNPKVPDRRRVGVGYRDKGSKRDLAYDGSPDWTEVSKDQAFQEKEVRREVEKCQSIAEVRHLYYRAGCFTEEQLRDYTLAQITSKEDPEEASR
jgi:hypothetical protein